MSGQAPRVLLDECLPHDLRHELSDFDIQTAAYAGVAGLSNGEMIAAIEGRFDIFVTVDASLPDQQDLSRRKLAVIILRVRTNRLADILPLIPSLRHQFGSLRAGDITIIPAP